MEEQKTSSSNPEKPEAVVARLLPDFSKVPASKEEWKMLAKKSTIFPGDKEKYFELLLKHESDIQSHNWDFEIPLLTLAARKGDLDLVKQLRMRSVQYEATALGYTALHAACDIGVFQDKLELVEFLVKEQLPINAQTKYYCETPLFIAVRNRLANSVTILIRNHANSNIASSTRTPLIDACERFDGDFTILSVLIKEGRAEVNATDVHGNTPLHIAYDTAIFAKTKEGQAKIRQELIAFLLSNGADPNRLNRWGKKPNETEKIVHCNN